MVADAEGKETVHVMSEVGVTKILNQFSDAGEKTNSGMSLLQSGRLGPGEMLSVNLNEGKMYLNDELKAGVAASQPYAEWVKKAVVPLDRKPFTGGE